ncbi:O-antigen ligase family protein [Kosmotoga pacifica]|uniref:O-antigen ligase-related domain-containing protein n=1 Tax=Kosmotoga pacifica TaxID=1330330 RepID=A0A0G2ZAA1_9BACT|nr:O-antigen ligase [Kosmotoga pacifica]AKI97011.1 hypothetical protein IX53_03310 [Kosmotoga pacifica]
MQKDKWLYSILVTGSFFFTLRGLTWDMGLPKFYFASVILAIIFIYVALHILRERKEINSTIYFLPPILFGLYAVISTFFIDTPKVIFSSLGFAINLLVFIMFSLIFSKKKTDFILWVLQYIVLMGMIIAVDSLIAFYSGHSILWGNEFGNSLNRGNISSLIGNVNFTTDLMGLLIPFTIYLAISKKRIWKMDLVRKIFYTIVFTLLLSVVMAGQTRGVYLALIGALILSGIGVLLARLKGTSVLKSINIPMLIALIMISFSIIYGYSTDSFLTRGSFDVSERLTYISEDRTSIDVRMLQWKAAIKQWNSAKLTGTGFGTYKFYSTENMGRVVSDEPKYMYVNGLLSIRTHNEFLQMLAETGIVGVSLILLSLIGFVWYFFKNILTQRDTEKLLLFLAATASFTVITLHSVVSFPGHLMPNALIAVIVAGVALSEELRGFRAFRIELNGRFVRSVIAFLLIVISLTGTVLMSRNYFSEAYFTKGYIAKLNFDSANLAIPDLKNTINMIRSELSSLESFEGEFSYLATDTYINTYLQNFKDRFPRAPEELLVSELYKRRKNTVDMIEEKLKNKLKSMADTLMNARNASNENFYDALYSLDSALTFEDHSGMPKTYLALLMSSEAWMEDLNLKLFNLTDPMGQLEKFFSGINGYNEKIAIVKPRAFIVPLLLKGNRHLPLKELPDLIKHATEEASLTNILKELDMPLLFSYQSIFDSIDMGIAALQITPDIMVIRFLANQFFRAFSESSVVAKELRKLEKYLGADSTESLKELEQKILNIPDEYRLEFEYLYDKAIELNPGGWNIHPDWENIYSDYIEQLMLTYGDEAIKKCLEIAEKEVFACKIMKNTHWGIPDRSFEMLFQFSEISDNGVLKEEIMRIYEPAYQWNKEQLETFYNERIEPLEKDDENRQRYLNVLERMKKFTKTYESKK